MRHHSRSRRILARTATLLASAVLLSLSFGLFNPFDTAIARAQVPSSKAPDSTCLQPPKKVDLTTFSDVQLATYGLPPHPRDIAELSQWQLMLHHAKHRWCTETPTNIRHTQENSSNWAGIVSVGGGYSAVIANWYIPCIADTPTNSTEAMWVGLGGDGADGGGNLVQTGSESDVNGSRQISTYVWWEVLGAQGQNVVDETLFNASCLDYISAKAYNSYGGGCIIIEDDTNGNYSGPPCESGWGSNGSTAEWIIERTSPCLDCGPGTLANFSPEEAQFTSAQTYHNGWLNVGSTNHHTIVMYAGSLECAHPGSIGSGTYFTIYYDVPSGKTCS